VHVHRFAAAATALVVLAAACHRAQVRPAPFRSRPDSVDAGSLLGPFDGRVLDAGNGDPVTGALVYGTWTFQSGYGLQAPSHVREAVTSTDASGRYRIPRLDDLPSGAHLTDFTLVIYKRGYVAYRSDRRFEDLGPRLDFAQRQHLIKMDRWRAEYSHVRHLRYVGGGPAIAALTAWETDEAAAELSGLKEGPRVASDLIVSGGPGITASQIVNDSDLRSMTGWDGSFETGPLNDEPDTDVYSSQHFRALGQPETFDVAVRLWKVDSQSARDRYAELGEMLPGVRQTGEIADQSFRATEKDPKTGAEILGVAFLDEKRGVVVLLTCGTAQCKTLDTLVAVGRKAYDRVRRAVPENAGANGAEDGEPPPEDGQVPQPPPLPRPVPAPPDGAAPAPAPVKPISKPAPGQKPTGTLPRPKAKPNGGGTQP
jgi:hypothetical protein